MAKYSLTFKLKIVTTYLNSEGGYEYLTKKYGLNKLPLIAHWKSEFMKYGVNAFVERPKGRIPKMSRTDEKAKITTHTKLRNHKQKKELTSEQARILELEK